MAKSNVFLPSVNAGEFSPDLDARIDFEKYPHGAKRLKNVTLLPQGGWERRSGLRFIAGVKEFGFGDLMLWDNDDEMVWDGDDTMTWDA